MAGTALLINPRRRRRRKARKARSSRRRARRVRRNPFAVARRRRRRGHRRAHARRGRRRAHRNPRLPLIGSVNFPAIGAGAAGYIATAWGGPQLFNMLPPDWKTNAQMTPLLRIGAKAAVGLVLLPMVAKMVFPRKGLAGPMALGAGIAIAVDLFKSYLAPAMGITLEDYETQTISAYETAQLTGDADAYGNSAYGGGGYAY
jgi:hypothetical protein